MMSAALKRAPEPTPTPFPSPERAALAHAIAAAADAAARRVALEKAAQSANADVLRAIQAVESAEAALAEVQGNAAKHIVDVAMGVVAKAPMTPREARALVISAQDELDEYRQTRQALKTALEQSNQDFAQMRVTDAARAVVRVEMRERAIALAASVAALQKALVVKGSALEWLHRAGVFPAVEHGADDLIGHTVGRLQVAPQQWALGAIRYATSFAEATGGNALQTAYEGLKLDPNAPLPDLA